MKNSSVRAAIGSRASRASGGSPSPPPFADCPTPSSSVMLAVGDKIDREPEARNVTVLLASVGETGLPEVTTSGVFRKPRMERTRQGQRVCEPRTGLPTVKAPLLLEPSEIHL